MVLRFIYSLFIGILFVAFVGFGIDAIYHSPKSPDYPSLQTPAAMQPTTTQQADMKKFQQQQQTFQEQLNTYNKNVSLILLIIALLVLILTLFFLGSMPVFADGFLFGGMFTLLYSIARSFATQDSLFRFILITVAFVIALFVGYIHFIRTTQKKK